MFQFFKQKRKTKHALSPNAASKMITHASLRKYTPEKMGIAARRKNLKDDLWQKAETILRDHWQLLIRSAAENHLRIQQCKQKPVKGEACGLEFDSYTELKQYQKKVRLFTYSFSSTLASALIVVLVIQIFFPGARSQGATYNFVQTNWNGGQTANSANHDLNQSGWNQYSAKDANLAIVNGGNDLQLVTQPVTATQTSSSGTGDTPNAGGFNAGTNAGTAVVGSGASASVQIAQTVTPVNNWAAPLTAVPGVVEEGGSMLRDGASNDIYVLQGNNTKNFYKYSISGNSWTTLALSPQPIYSSARMIRNGSEDYIYTLAFYGNSFFLRYQISTNTWTTLANTPGTMGDGMRLLRNGSSDSIYATRGGDSTAFYKYSIAGNFWTAMAPAPGRIYSGGGMISNNGLDDFIYVWGGSGYSNFYEYSITNNTWRTLAALPGIFVNGATMIRNGTDNYIYALQGWNSTGFYRYSLSGDSWTALTAVPGTVDAGSAMIRNGSDNDIYVLRGNSSTSFYKYSVSGNSWTTLPALAGAVGRGGALVRNGADNEIYVLQGGTTAGFYKFIINTVTYNSPVTFTSAVIDTGSGVPNWNNLSWTSSQGQTISLKVRTGASVAAVNAAVWGSATTTSPTSLATLGAQAGHRYIQYQATLSTADNTQTPSLDSLTFTYDKYVASQTLTSSPYNSNDLADILVKMKWTENLPAGTDATFQVRTSPDGSSWTSWVGPGGTSATSFTDPAGGETMPNVVSNASGDQWIQYKVTLASDGGATPTLSDATMVYVANATPQIQNVASSQGTDGKVTTTFEVRDIDTTSGSLTPGTVLGGLQYCTANCSNPGSEVWANATTLTYKDSDDNVLANNTLAVEESNWRAYTIVWNPKADYSGNYASNFKVRVNVNDSELANNIGYGVSGNYVFDTKDPAKNVADTVFFVIDRTQDLLTIKQPVENTNYEVYVSNSSSDLFDAGKKTSPLINQASTYPVAYTYGTMPAEDQRIYVGVKDEKGNTATFYAVSPEIPKNNSYWDLTNTTTGEYREFISWRSISQMGAGFSEYQVWRSADDNNSYAKIATITNSTINYFFDTGLNPGTHYYYKILAKDSSGNLSAYSNEIDDTPNGQGGSDQTAPAVSNVAISEISTTSAKVTWQTDELADSAVGYSTDLSYLTERSLPTMGLDHTLVLTGLTPNTTYNVKVKSRDIVGNLGSATGFSFSTTAGPAISNVTVTEISNNQATVSWLTTTDSSSYVTYSDTVSGGNLVGPIEVGAPALVGGSAPFQHLKTINGLIAGRTYYFSVKSVDGSGNIATDNNGGNFYQLTMTNDTTPPVITENSGNPIVLTDADMVLGFSASKKAQARLAYRKTTDVSFTYTAWSEGYNLEHVIALNDLTKETGYYYFLEARDQNDNYANSALGFIVTKQKQTDHPELADPGNPVVIEVSDTDAFVAIPAANTTSISELCYDVNPIADMDSCANQLEINDLTKTHVYHLSGLAPNTTYHIKTKIVDSIYPGIVFVSDDVSFATMESLVTHPELTDPGGPFITQKADTEMVVSLPTTNTTSVSKLCWDTSSIADVDSCANSQTINVPTRTHVYHLTNLDPNTAYYVKTKVTDALDGNVAFVSNEVVVSTNEPQVAHPVLTAPVSDDAQVLIFNDTQAIVKIIANSHNTAELCYATDPISDGEFTTCLNGDPADGLHLVSDSSESFAHAFNLGSELAGSDNAPLSAKTKYYYRIRVTDTRDFANKFTLADKEFTTKKTQLDQQDSLASISTPGQSDITLGQDYAFIAWSTDQPANSAIGCSTEAGRFDVLLSSNLTDFSKQHLLMVSGLASDSKYYCQVTSTDPLVPATSLNAQFSFTTQQGVEFQHPPLSQITFTDPNPSILTDRDAVISFATDQGANCFVEYKEAASSSGWLVEKELADTYNKNHNIHLSNLLFSTAHSYKVTCIDNLPDSQPLVYETEDGETDGEALGFTTKEKMGTEGDFLGQNDKVPPTISNVKVASVSGESVTITWDTDEKGSSSVGYGSATVDENGAADQFVNKSKDNFTTSHSVTITGLIPATKYIFVTSSTDASGNISQSSQADFTTASPSSLSSIKAESKNLGEAVITWKTDQDATSTVEYGLTTSYGEKKESLSYATEHSITLSNLNQGTTYHYRVKGKDKNDHLYASADQTFEPKSPPKIDNISINDVTEHGVKVSFRTNVPTDANVTYTDVTNQTQTGSQGSRDLATEHTIALTNLNQGTTFSLTLEAKDEQGTNSSAKGPDFTTGKDENPPKIDQVRTDSALTQSDKVQAIINWKTDEQATTSLIYKEGRNADPKEVKITDNLTTGHIAVITTFKPGTVYYFKAKSIDASGNEALSNEFALLTPRRKENIIQIIINNFQDIFGWARR